MTELLQGPNDVDRVMCARQVKVDGPFMPTPYIPPRARFVRMSLAAIAVMVGVAAGLCVLVTKNTELQAAELKTKASTTFVKPTMVLAAAKRHPMRGKNVNAEPSGIALSADSVAAASDEAPVPSAAQRDKEKVATKAKTIKAPSRHVKVSGSVETAEIQTDEEELSEASPKLDAETLGDFDKALEIDANDQKAWKGKLTALQQSDTPEAIGEIQKMIERRPQSGAAYAALAQTFAQQGDNASAAKAWHRAVELDPSNKSYRLSLAVLYDRMGQDDEALALYKQVPKPLPYAAKKRLDYLSARVTP